MEIYVVVEFFDVEEGLITRMEYCGTDKEKAFSYRSEDSKHIALQVWNNEIALKQYEMKDDEWELTFDVEKELEDEITSLKEELKDKEGLLSEIKEMTK